MPLILFCVFEALFAPVSVGGRRDKAHWGLGCWVDAGDVVLSQFGLCVELPFLLGGVCVCGGGKALGCAVYFDRRITLPLSHFY